MDADAGLTAEHPVKAEPKRRWFRYSLRTLLVLTLLLGAALGWLSRRVHEAREQRAAAREIEQWGAKFTFQSKLVT